jgi:hypothetical protein
MATRLGKLYADDFVAWTVDQAAALRRLAELRPNDELDLEHLIEEVEDLGASRRRAVRSQVRRIIEHLLKLQHSPAEAPRAGWCETIIDARGELRDALTPTLRRDLEDSLAELHAQARRDAAQRLRLHGEEAAAGALPLACPYTVERILDEEWLPPAV